MKADVLHITNWYPTPWNKKEALWIQNQIEALDAFKENKVYHVKVEPGKGWALRTHNLKRGGRSYYLSFPMNTWMLAEVITTVILLYIFVFKEKVKSYQLVNFHIAYPLLTYYSILKKWLKVPILISEHWSAYHFHFNVPNKKKLGRIKRIFSYDIPLATVSDSLRKDIEVFSDHSISKTKVIPNVIDTDLFRPDPSLNTHHGRFFMVSNWRWPKDPLTVLKAFNEISKKNKTAELFIGGYGPMLDDMKKMMEEMDDPDRVHFLGVLDADRVALEMNKAHGFLHCSEHETFSVVCAEALCCGTPVIASNVGGIPEVVEGIGASLVENNDVDVWVEAMEELMEMNITENGKKEISRNSSNRFSKGKVGDIYREFIDEITDGKAIPE